MQMKSLPVRLAVLVVAGLAVTALPFPVARHFRKSVNSSVVAKQPVAAVNRPAEALVKQDLANAYGKLPMAFEANEGQSDPDVRYLSRGAGYELFLTNQEAVLELRQQQPGSKFKAAEHRKLRGAETATVLRMRFNGSNPAPEVAGTDRLPGNVNYLIGNDPKKWHTDVPSYSSVHYKNVYPGVDALFYGRERRLEYDFIVAPGADPKAIALNMEGARKLGLNSRGDVVINVAGGKLALQKPVVYQEINGERREVAGNYAISKDQQIRFAIGDYDHTQPLTIDPVLTYSTYVGGTGVDTAFGIALDAAGDAYIAGTTTSPNFPPGTLTPPADVALGTVFVAELNPTGTTLLYSTYLGGTGSVVQGFGEGADAIAVDGLTPTSIYVTGYTYSTDFPLSTSPAPFQATAPGSTSNGGAAFFTKLTPSLTGAAQIAYSTYLGGSTQDEGHGIAVDATGIAYIGGGTESADFPLKGTPQITTTLKSASGNAFLAKFNATLSGTASLVYSTYLGGSGAASPSTGFTDVAYGIAVDSSANAYLTGATDSADFPTMGTAIPGSTACGATGDSSVFVTEIATTTPALVYSNCLSGSTAASFNIGYAISLGAGIPAASNIAYVTGTTDATDFPTTLNSIPPAAGLTAGGAFVSLVNTTSATTPLEYSTFLSGNNGDAGFGIAADASGNAYVTGITASQDFPITQGAYQVTLNNLNGAGFVSKINPAGNAMADLVYSTYFGGSGSTVTGFTTIPDISYAIAVSGTNAYIAGQAVSPATGANPFPTTTGAFQTALAGPQNAFVAELPLLSTISVTPTVLDFGTQLIGTPTEALYATVTNNTAAPVTLTIPPTITGANSADFAVATGGTCTTSLAAGASCKIGATFTPSITGAETGALQLVDSLDGAGHPVVVALTGTGSTTEGVITISPTSLTFGGQLLTTTSAAQMITLSNPSASTSLVISAIASSNADFTVTSTSCGTFPITIAVAGAPCVLSVTFNPSSSTTVGADTGTITITDNANASPQSVSLTGTAWDFSLTGPSSAVSVPSGVATTFPVTITGLGGFTGSVALTCAGSSNVSACTVTPSSSGPGMVTVSVTATNATSGLIQPFRTPPAAALRPVALVVLGIGMLFMIPMTRRFRTQLGLAGAMLVFVVLAGCSGGGGHHQTGTGTVTITGTSSTVSKTVTVNLTIT